MGSNSSLVLKDSCPWVLFSENVIIKNLLLKWLFYCRTKLKLTSQRSVLLFLFICFYFYFLTTCSNKKNIFVVPFILNLSLSLKVFHNTRHWNLTRSMFNNGAQEQAVKLRTWELLKTLTQLKLSQTIIQTWRCSKKIFLEGSAAAKK